MNIASSLFLALAKQEGVGPSMAVLPKAIEAMRVLEEGNKQNCIYNLMTALANGNLDLDRMPFSLIEANVAHFAGEKVMIRQEYKSRLETIYCQFGEKFMSLYSGPHFKWTGGEDTADDDEWEDVGEDKENELVQARQKQC